MVVQQQPSFSAPEHWDGRPIGAELHGGLPSEPKSPNYALWLFYLYFRPRTFFRQFVVEHLWFTTIVAAFLFGLSSAIDRIESRAAIGSASGGAMWAVQSWERYAAIVLAAGVFGAAMYYVLGGWWYRVRLVWSGAQTPDRVLARRVYVYASTVHALPMVLTTVWEASRYATPIEAINAAGTPWYFALALFPLWSVVVSYVGVRTVFHVRGVRPAIWFLIAPGALYIVALAAMLIASALSVSGPQVASPIRYESAHVEMTLPGDWEVDTTDPDFEPAYYLPIVMPQGGVLQIYIEPAGEDPQELVDIAITSMLSSGAQSHPAAMFTKWGTMEGVGREVTMQLEGDASVMRVFAARVPDGRVLVAYELFIESEADSLRPGFDQVANSLVLKPLSDASPSP